MRGHFLQPSDRVVRKKAAGELEPILIAACALRAGVPVLTADKHFEGIPGLLVIPFLPR